MDNDQIIQLVPNASKWLRMYSNWVFMFISFVGIWQIVSPFLYGSMPTWVIGASGVLVGVAGILARLMKQFNISPTPDSELAK